MKDLSEADFEEIDIIPRGDIIEHTDGLDCICSPVWDAENKWNLHLQIDDKMVIVHRRIQDELQ